MKQLKKRKHMSASDMGVGTIKWIFLAVMIVFTLYPVIYTVIGSFKTNAELTQGSHFWPEEWHFENYYRAFVEADFAHYTLNSVM